MTQMVQVYTKSINNLMFIKVNYDTFCNEYFITILPFGFFAQTGSYFSKQM